MGILSSARVAQWRAAADGLADAVSAAHTEGEHSVIVRRWPRADAPCAVLVHGIGMGQQYFGLLRAELTRTFDVVTLDLPGFGTSPEPSQSLSMPELSDLVANAIEAHASVPCVAVGHSMGSQVVAELAARHPELVQSVVLIAPTVNAAERTGWQQALRLVQDLANDPPIVAAIGARLYLRTGPRWYLRKLRTMLDHDIRAVLPRIQQPTLVIRGDEDRVAPADWVRQVVAGLPDGRLRVAEGRGHEAMVTGAEPVASMIQEFAGADHAA
ncbi:alpha/beta fold hydrolase [Agrococcus sp. Ld7]|uniref:alpha/beta fold hydrolase n=1 Tax=Agrococcus sp. Ld7 TaxID=649148 RepID=UPI00386CCD58